MIVTELLEEKARDGEEMTDEKLALLEQITYIDENVLKAAGINKELLEITEGSSVVNILELFDDKALNNLRNYRKKTLFNIGNKEKQNIVDGALISGKDWANIIETIRSDEELKNLVVKDSEQITTKKGKKYNLQICYQDPISKQGIITYKGTTGYEEWDDNVKAIYQKDTPCQDDALKFFQRNEKSFDDIVLVGHSKGANKAMYTTIVSDSDKISKCIGMDGQGFSNEFFEGYVAQIEKHGSKITNYSVDRDFVHVLMKQIPNSEQKYCEAYGVQKWAQFHSPFTMFKSNDGKMELNGSDKSPVFVDTNENRNTALLRKFTTYLMDKGEPEDVQKIANYIGPLVGDLLGNGSLLKALYQAIVGNL
ncbi:Mbeg1-like protein, partial [Pseudobutyrivibrio ruminis]